MMRDGRESGYGSVSRFTSAQSYYLHSPGPASYGTMSLPVDEMAALAEIVGSPGQTSPDDRLVITPTPSALAKLQRLHEAASGLAEDAPAVLDSAEARHSLEQALIEAMLYCLDSGETHEDRAARRHHAAIMRRFHRFAEERLDEPVYVPELCREIGSSLRTLNTCCQEHLGMGAKRYLLLRRMNMVRRALRESSSGQTTVTEAATRYGFWQFGRFAVEYKALFGEAPSATLARAP